MAQRIVFFGTPEFAVPALDALAAAGHLLLVVTQSARPQGRGLAAAPSAVARRASALGLPLIERRTLRDPGDLDPIRGFAPDLLVVVAFGVILSPSLLALPRLGAVNLHPSLLPRHRGVAPIPWTILAGDRTTGVATIQMDEGIDTGDLLAMVEVDVAPEENAVELRARLAELGAPLVPHTVDALAGGTIAPRPQPSAGATYAPRLRKEHGHLAWTESAAFLARQVRAMAGWPGARARLGVEVIEIQAARAVAGERGGSKEAGIVLAVDREGIRIATGDGVLLVTGVQAAGKRAMPAADFARGRRIESGARFESLPGADLLPQTLALVLNGGGWPAKARASAPGTVEGGAHA